MTQDKEFFTSAAEYTPQQYRRLKVGTRNHPQIVRYFDKTPESIICPHFYELNWAYGCPYNCSYCYLQGTLRGNKTFRTLPLHEVLATLQEVFDDNGFEPSIFNTGELADSLGHPETIAAICDKFETQKRHKILLLTKSSDVDLLVEEPRNQTIVSFSINAPDVSRRWEKGAPSTEDRIEAARRTNEAGYETRIRIDPMFPVEDWRQKYDTLVYDLLDSLQPERVTLGTPRGLAKTLMFSKDLSWTSFFSEKTSWGKKISSALRKEMYLFALDRLSELGYRSSNVSMCKETETLWRELGLLGNRPKCNCVW